MNWWSATGLYIFGCLNFSYFIFYIILLFPQILYFRVYLSFHVIHIGVFSNVHKILLYLYIFNIMHLKYSIGIWVQSRKEDQILRLDLNPYWVIFKITHVSTVVVGSKYFRFEIFLGASVRDSPARWQRCFAAFACEPGSWIGSIGFWVLFLSFGFLFERFAAHSDGASPAYAGIVYSLFILDCMVLYLYLLLFCLFWNLSYFIHLAFRTHVSSCVHGGINHP
jgi:hypothetical protein